MQAHAPTLGIGYALCYGTIIAKMWRIYYIFHNPTTKKKVCLITQYEGQEIYGLQNHKFFLEMSLNILPFSKEIKDWHLTIAIVIMVAIAVVIVSFGLIIPEFRPTAQVVVDKGRPPMENVSDTLSYRLTLPKVNSMKVAVLLGAMLIIA